MIAYLNFLSKPDFWILLFIFIFQLVYASPEVILLGMAIAGYWIWFRRRSNYCESEYRIISKSHHWLVPICFSSIFFIKLISILWATNHKEAIGNAFNNIHFILWPGVMIFLSQSKISPRNSEPWIVFSMLILMAWFLIARYFFPASEDAVCFKAGGHNCGLLGHTIAFFLLWLFIAISRPNENFLYKLTLFVGLIAGWIAFLGTVRRTELLGLLLAMLVVIIWRFNQFFSLKRATIAAGFCATLLVFIWPVMQPRFVVVESEVSAYLQGGENRLLATQTSVGARLEMYRIAIEAIGDKPFLGWGAGLKPKHVAQYATDPENPYPYSNFHQQYLQIFLEVGILGGAIIGLMAIYLIYQTIIIPWRDNSKELAVLFAALYFTYAWKGLAYASFGYSLPNAAFVFFSAWFWVAVKNRT